MNKESIQKKKRWRIVLNIIVIIIVLVEFIVMVCMAKKYDAINRKIDADLRIEDAVIYFDTAMQEEDHSYFLASVRNNGATVERYLPTLYVTDSEEPYVYGQSLVPISYYEDINAAGGNNFDYNICIPPGQTVTISYMLTKRNMQEIEAMQQNSKQLYVYLPERKTAQPICIPLQVITIQTT